MVEMKAPWMRVAQALQGEAEIAGSLANPRIIEMFKVAGCPDTPDFRTDETAWCAAFVNSCLRLSGYSGTNSALASSFADFGIDLGRTPQAGCIVLFRPLAGGSGHVGFFAGDDGENIQVLGGNQSDKVKIARFPKSKWRAFRWPSETVPIPEEHVLPTILTLAPEDAPDHIRVAGKPGALVVPIAADNFNRLQPIIDHWEGGFSDHPLDPGGPTNMGITQETLARWRKHDVSKEDVKNLQRDEAWHIFRSFYWDPLRCDEIPIALALITYNAGVNSGIGRGARWLQQALNKQGANLDVDGSVGPLTLNACARFDVARAVTDFAGIQESFLRGLDTFATFGNGWMNRLNDVKSKAMAIASEPVVVVDRTPSAAVEPSLQSILEKLVASLKETHMVATTVPSTQITTGGQTPFQISVAGKTSDDILSLAQQLALLLQKLNVQGKSSTDPATRADQLRQFAELITAILPGAKPILGQVNGALGETVGNLLNGKKSAIGIIGALATSLLSAVPSGSGLGQILAMITPAAGLSGFAMPIFLAVTAWGALGKFEKWAQGTAPLPVISK